jgi:hypothetical protein
VKLREHGGGGLAVSVNGGGFPVNGGWAAMDEGLRAKGSGLGKYRAEG